MASTYNKFQIFASDLVGKVHDLLGTAGAGADTLKVYLSNVAPSASLDAVKADLAEITNQFGYTAPVSVANAGVAAAGTVTVTGTNVTITAAGGSVGPFQYVALYNDTPASPVDPLIAWWDYGTPLTLADGESFQINFNASAVSGTIFTLV